MSVFNRIPLSIDDQQASVSPASQRLLGN